MCCKKNDNRTKELRKKRRILENAYYFEKVEKPTGKVGDKKRNYCKVEGENSKEKKASLRIIEEILYTTLQRLRLLCVVTARMK